jgi:hypothetical protein
MSPIYNPTLEDFLRSVRQEFHFLVAELGFKEQRLPRHRDANQFQVRYRNATTLVEVEGINWGYGVNVLGWAQTKADLPAEGYFPALADCEAKEA